MDKTLLTSKPVEEWGKEGLEYVRNRCEKTIEDFFKDFPEYYVEKVVNYYRETFEKSQDNINVLSKMITFFEEERKKIGYQKRIYRQRVQRIANLRNGGKL